jgi:hypothetical protein
MPRDVMQNARVVKGKNGEQKEKVIQQPKKSCVTEFVGNLILTALKIPRGLGGLLTSHPW